MFFNTYRKGGVLELFREYVAQRMNFSLPLFKGTSCYIQQTQPNPRYYSWQRRKPAKEPTTNKIFTINEKVRALLEISASQFHNALMSLPKESLDQVFFEFVKIQNCTEESDSNQNIVDWEEVSRTSQIKMIISLFKGSKDVVLEKRSVEKEFVSESIDEVENIFITFRFKHQKTNEDGTEEEFYTTHEFPKHLVLEILDFMEYDSELIFSLGSVCKDFYLLILSSWRRIHVNPRGVFDVSLLVLNNIREISFTRKSISLSKREMFYLWDNVDGNNIQVFDISKCHSGLSRFVQSISSFRKTPKNEEEEEQKSEPIVFRRCHTLILPSIPKKMSVTESLHPSSLILSSHHFPSLHRLVITTPQINGFLDLLEKRKESSSSKKSNNLIFPTIQHLEITLPSIGLGKLWSGAKNGFHSLFHMDRLKVFKIRMKELNDPNITQRYVYNSFLKKEDYEKLNLRILDKCTNLESFSSKLILKANMNHGKNSRNLFPKLSMIPARGIKRIEFIQYPKYVEKIDYVFEDLLLSQKDESQEEKRIECLKICPLGGNGLEIVRTIMISRVRPLCIDVSVEFANEKLFIDLLRVLIGMIPSNPNVVQDFRVCLLENYNEVVSEDLDDVYHNKNPTMTFDSDQNLLVVYGPQPNSRVTGLLRGVWFENKIKDNKEKKKKKSIEETGNKKKEIGEMIGKCKRIEKIEYRYFMERRRKRKKKKKKKRNRYSINRYYRTPRFTDTQKNEKTLKKLRESSSMFEPLFSKTFQPMVDMSQKNLKLFRKSE